MKYNFDPNQEYTKKEISSFTGLSENTVVESLKTAGLSTSNRRYSGVELNERFVPVRLMLEGGRTHEEIREAIGMRYGEPKDDADRSQQANSSLSGTGIESIEDEIAKGMEQAVKRLVDAAVEDIIEYIPGMVAVSLGEAARTGRIQEAFTAKMREYFVQRRSLTYGSPPIETPALPLRVEDKELSEEEENTVETSERNEPREGNSLEEHS